MNTKELQTERLKLKKLTPEIFQFAFENLSESQLLSFFGFDSIAELEMEKEKYKKGISTYNKTFLYFQLIEKETDKIIGWCGFHTWYIEHKRAEIGYVMTDENFKDKGLMTEAIKPIIEYGFTIMQLNRIEAFVEPENIPSLKLIEKLNFVKEGLLRKHYFKNNRMEDSIVFSILKSEYVLK